MSLQQLLVDRGLTTALIVDDGYDAVPRAQDMMLDEDAWSNFFADLGDNREQLIAVFPAFEALTGPQLRQSDEFVAAAWTARERLRPELWDLLFSGYEQLTGSDRKFLANLEAALTAIGVTPIPSGRETSGVGRDAKIIFADLFMGTAQEPGNIELAIARLQDLLKDREHDPPIVILMSRSDLLNDKKAYVRDSARLLGALFRVHRKAELLKRGTLERTLTRLALHRPDAVRVARFVQSWEKGLSEASERFLGGIRRLDLSDYAQIREVLLDFEGQPLGSYLLDVFDRVLQHEIEGDETTIRAAEALNRIDPNLYPAPYISGTADLQDLVYRTIWQNPKRLRVKATVADIPVGFGDVLVRRPAPRETATVDAPDVLVVLTPACDLVRVGGLKRVLLVGGKLSLLTSRAWSYSDDIIKTPILVLPEAPGEARMWLQWDTKDVRTLLPAEVSSLIGEAGSYYIALRLRESHALELQQRVLASLGRVGLIAFMPATFPVEISAYSFDASLTPNRISLPILEKEGGVCYTGRDARGEENCRLVLTEPAIDELLDVIQDIKEAAVNPRAVETLRRLKASTSLATELQLGLKVPASNKTAFKELKSSAMGDDGQPFEQTIGLIARNPSEIKTSQPKLSGFVLVLTDPSLQRTADEAGASASATDQ